MKIKTLLVLCLVSWAFDALGGIYFTQKVLDTINPTPGEFNWIINIVGNLVWFASWFWKFGFPIFFGNLFTKTKRTTWWVWVIATALYLSVQMGDLIWKKVIFIPWWDQAYNWINNSIIFLAFLAWVFYGGLIFQKLTKDVDFSKFEISSTLTYLKEWYTNLIK